MKISRNIVDSSNVWWCRLLEEECLTGDLVGSSLQQGETVLTV